MGTERTHFGTCVLSTGDVYVTGGVDGDVGRLSSVEMYSPSSDAWSTVASMPQTRSPHVAVAIDRTIFVLGGRLISDAQPMPEVCDSPAACAVGTHIYVFGNSESVFKYDTVAKEWSILAPMPCASLNHSAAVVGDLVYIVGAGYSECEVLRFDLKSKKWDAVATTLLERKCGSALVLGGCLHALGGPRGDYFLEEMERYDNVSNTWTVVAESIEGRSAFGAVTINKPLGPAEERYQHDLFDMLIVKSAKYNTLTAGIQEVNGL
jgi:hypothetical protein